MQKVEFNDLSDIFKYTIWTSEKETFWYEKAWRTLENQGLTTYNNSHEYCDVVFLALAIVYSYCEFYNITWVEGDIDDSPDFDENVYDYISEIEIGQMLVFNNIISEQSDLLTSTNEALTLLASNSVSKLYHALRNEMSDEEILAWMYSTGETYYKEVYDEEYDDFFEEEYDCSDFNEYSKMIDELKDNILSGININMFCGYQWIANGMRS